MTGGHPGPTERSSTFNHHASPQNLPGNRHHHFHVLSGYPCLTFNGRDTGNLAKFLKRKIQVVERNIQEHSMQDCFRLPGPKVIRLEPHRLGCHDASDFAASSYTNRIFHIALFLLAKTLAPMLRLLIASSMISLLTPIFTSTTEVKIFNNFYNIRVLLGLVYHLPTSKGLLAWVSPLGDGIAAYCWRSHDTLNSTFLSLPPSSSVLISPTLSFYLYLSQTLPFSLFNSAFLFLSISFSFSLSRFLFSFFSLFLFLSLSFLPFFSFFSLFSLSLFPSISLFLFSLKNVDLAI
ncbi:unnamed protein product [Acanthosepion pharaonis]|uniref:Uncharacterized protein n=1 Tax=Acanthosepion pharaonis TaxID=158019 RepID=A0A812CN05_ACAPH|nr:unnamed protein product [Sepia pharaonis]